MDLRVLNRVALFFIVIVSLVFTLLLSPKADAAPARCYNSLGSIGGGDSTVTDCSSMTSLTPPGYQFQEDKCYELVVSGGSFSVGEANCAQGVFSRNSGDTVVKCADNQMHSGQGTAEEVCAPHGGTAEAVRDDEERVSNPQRDEALDCSGPEECFDKNPLVSVIKVAINFMTGLVGVVVVVVIIWAGIEYSSSGGDPNRTAGAKKRIINAIIALVSFIFLWAFLQWLVPGSPF